MGQNLKRIAISHYQSSHKTNTALMKNTDCMDRVALTSLSGRWMTMKGEWRE